MTLVSLVRARALLERVSMLENDIGDGGIGERLRRDPKWLLLPPAKQRTALERHHALLAYDEIERPSIKEADIAAETIGVGRRIFYRLLADWRENGKSVFSLVPYRTLAKPRQSKLPEAVVTALREAAKAILAENRAIWPSTAVRLIRESWPEKIPQPSGVTIRNYIDREMAERPTQVGSMWVEVGAGRMAAKLTADKFGEVLVVDHSAPARLRVDGRPARAPTLTLVIDLHTGVPVGAAVTMVRPSSQAAFDALADARARLMRRMTGQSTTPPTIVAVRPSAAKWSHELAILREHGCRVLERGVLAHRIGEMVRMLVGPKLDGIPLMAARSDEDGVFEVDVEQEALLTLQEARFVIDVALERLLDERFPTDVAHGMSPPLLPELLANRADLATLSSAENAESTECHAKGESTTVDNVLQRSNPRDCLRKLAITVGGDDLAGVSIQEPTPAEPYWIVDLRPSSPAVGQRIWSDISRAVADTNKADDEGVVVRLRPAHA